MSKLQIAVACLIMVFALTGFTCTQEENQDFNIVTATEITSHMRVGWNLGNTLDARGERYGFSWLGGGVYANTTVEEMETAWVSHVASCELINAVYKAGFNTLRIPVSWFKAADENFNIRQDWMDRVVQVVNYGVANNMYIILNSHHDEYIFSLLDDYMEETKIAFEAIWSQIADTFINYNERLIFQGMNEPRTRGSPAEWSGGTAEERANLNILNQLFVDTIRASGGNNIERVLMIPTIAASMDEVAMRALVLPTDIVEDRIIVTMHSYAPVHFALLPGPHGTRTHWNRNTRSDTQPITSQIDRAYDLFVSQGIPVVITEMGNINRDNTRARVDWAEFFVEYASSKGIPSVWWDNGNHVVTYQNPWGYSETFGLFDRGTAELIHPLIVEALMGADNR